MSNQEQFTPGVLPSDAKLGTDDPEDEADQLDSQLTVDHGEDLGEEIEE